MYAGWLPTSWVSSQRQEERPLLFWNKETFPRTPTAGRLPPVMLPAPDQVPTEDGVKLGGSRLESLEGGPSCEVSSSGEEGSGRLKGW